MAHGIRHAIRNPTFAAACLTCAMIDSYLNGAPGFA